MSDLIELITRTTPLTKHGNMLIGKCPFHNEGTPSFMVNPEKQEFICLGCAVSGGIQEFRRLSGMDGERD